MGNANKTPHIHSGKKSIRGHQHNGGNSNSSGGCELSSENDGTETEHEHISKKKSRQFQTAALQTLFQKLELTADSENKHPGELSRATFENAFHGPLHQFGKLMFLQMTGGNNGAAQERIQLEQFIKAGREIMKMYDEKSLVKYYFHLFSAGKDHLTKEDAKLMFEIAFSLTLSLSKILYEINDRDDRVFTAMVTSLFGIKTEIEFDEFVKWLNHYCPHIFNCVHNWVTHILNGSALPNEMEMARVPQLEGKTSENNCTSMAILWLLSITLPPTYTKLPQESLPHSQSNPSLEGATGGPSSSGATKDPMWTSLLLLRKIARLPQVSSWKLLYNSDEKGMSLNRFSKYVSSYNAANITFFAFEGRNLYCLALDRGWREGPTKFGGEDCRLIQLLPVYRVIQAGENMVRWNEFTRGPPKGIYVGCDGKTEVLHLTEDFDSIYHYGVKCELHKIEVWGCGSEGALIAQQNQRSWEEAAVRREQQRRLRPEVIGETWRDTPDKQLLQWGGVDVGNHSYNRN